MNHLYIFPIKWVDGQRGKDCDIMLTITDKASEEIQKLLATQPKGGKSLILYFQGYG